VETCEGKREGKYGARAQAQSGVYTIHPSPRSKKIFNTKKAMTVETTRDLVMDKLNSMDVGGGRGEVTRHVKGRKNIVGGCKKSRTGAGEKNCK